MARPDASSSSIKPLTTRDNLKTQPILSLKPEALHNDTLYNVIIGTLRGNFQCGNIVRIELIAKKGNSLADRRQLRVFSQNNCLLFTVYATESLLNDNPEEDPSLLQIFESLLLSVAQQITEDILDKLQTAIGDYQESRSDKGLPNNEHVVILHRKRLPQGWGSWQHSVKPLV